MRGRGGRRRFVQHHTVPPTRTRMAPSLCGRTFLPLHLGFPAGFCHTDRVRCAAVVHCSGDMRVRVTHHVQCGGGLHRRIGLHAEQPPSPTYTPGAASLAVAMRTRADWAIAATAPCAAVCGPPSPPREDAALAAFAATVESCVANGEPAASCQPRTGPRSHLPTHRRVTCGSFSTKCGLVEVSTLLHTRGGRQEPMSHSRGSTRGRPHGAWLIV
jgi:hypothetical protein